MFSEAEFINVSRDRVDNMGHRTKQNIFIIPTQNDTRHTTRCWNVILTSCIFSREPSLSSQNHGAFKLTTKEQRNVKLSIIQLRYALRLIRYHTF